MKVIIPMSGHGRRFREAGYNVLKPLIRVDGKPIIQYVAELFQPDDRLIFVVNQEQWADPQSHLREVLSDLGNNRQIVPIPSKQPGGPNYAILGAAEFLDDEPVLVSYCDFNLLWDHEDFKKRIAERKPASAAVCYKGFHPHLLRPNLYAGVRADDQLNALEVREKFSFTENKMDTWQQAGLFYFSSGKLLKEYCERAFRENWLLKGESYTSLLFTPMIEDGLPSLVYPADFFCQWGTPADLEEYEAWSRLLARETGRTKGATDIPPEREDNIKIPWPEDSDEYRRSSAYWEEYFRRIV